jgi:predicted transcriptional regulator
MSNRKLPDTSLAANEAATLEMRKLHYGKIISALKVLRIAIYEEIADHVGMEKHQVGRRLCELEGMQIVCKPGSKKNTSSGRAAYQYCLTGTSQPKTEAVERALKGESVSDFSKNIKKIIDQPRLF